MSIYIRIDEWEIGGVDHVAMMENMNFDEVRNYVKNCMLRNELKKVFPFMSFNQKFTVSKNKEAI